MNTETSGAARRMTRTIGAAALLAGVLGRAAAATQIDVALVAPDPVVSVCEVLEVDLVLSGNGAGQPFDATDAILTWDPNVLELIGFDDTNAAANFFLWGFFNDPDGINDDLTDGDALFVALTPPGSPITAPAAPAAFTVITFQFRVLVATTGTDIGLMTNLGTFGETRVLLNGATFTGAVGGPVTASTPAISADIDESGSVGFIDLLIVLSSWGTCPDCCPADLDANGVVDFSDLLAVLAAWG